MPIPKKMKVFLVPFEFMFCVHYFIMLLVLHACPLLQLLGNLMKSFHFLQAYAYKSCQIICPIFQVGDMFLLKWRYLFLIY